MQAVVVKYKLMDVEALDAKVFEMRDSFTYNGFHFNIVAIEHPEAFVKAIVVAMDDVVGSVGASASTVLHGQCRHHLFAPLLEMVLFLGFFL